MAVRGRGNSVGSPHGITDRTNTPTIGSFGFERTGERRLTSHAIVEGLYVADGESFHAFNMGMIACRRDGHLLRDWIRRGALGHREAIKPACRAGPWTIMARAKSQIL